jgi:hypothetical protein
MLDLCRQLPRGEFMEVASGHLMPVQAPGELVAQSRYFLTRLDGDQTHGPGRKVNSLGQEAV